MAVQRKFKITQSQQNYNTKGAEEGGEAGVSNESVGNGRVDKKGEGEREIGMDGSWLAGYLTVAW